MKTFLSVLTFFLSINLFAEKPHKDFCALIERDIQDKLYSFMAGNKMYYIGGKVDEYWKPAHSETIGFTHPMFRDGRARGYGIVEGQGGKGHDKFGWEFWNHVKGAEGTVIIDGKRFKRPKPLKMLWRPDRVTCIYQVGGANITEVKFIDNNDVLATIISSDKDIQIEFTGYSFVNDSEFPTWDGDAAGQKFTQSQTATSRYDKGSNTIHVSEGGTTLTKSGWKETKVGKIMYDGMSIALSSTASFGDSVKLTRDNKGRQVYTFTININAGKSETLTYAQDDKYSVALDNSKKLLADPAKALNNKFTYFNDILNNQIPYFDASDKTAVKTYYYLWALYFMYYTDIGEGFEEYPHTQTAINNFMGLHLWDSWAYTAVGAWTVDKWKWGYGNVLSWKHMVPFKNKANGLPDNFGTTWYSPEVWMNLVGSVEFSWDMYRKSGDKKFLKELYTELWKPLYWDHAGPQASMGEELNALADLIKMAKELGLDEDVKHWEAMHPRMYKNWSQHWEAYAPSFYAAKGAPWKDIWNIISLMNREMPQAWADAMTERWIMNPEDGFLGPVSFLIRPMTDPPNGVFTVSSISTWLATEGLFRHNRGREGVFATLSHINGMNKTHGFPVAPECWEPEKFGPWGSLYYNWDVPIVDLLIKRIAGIDFSLKTNTFTVREHLPENWDWLETYIPVTVDGKTTWVHVKVDQMHTKDGLTKNIEVKNNPLAKLDIKAWTDSRETYTTRQKLQTSQGKVSVKLGKKAKTPKTFVTVSPVDRKFYRPMEITLQNLNQETTLRYTLDGSVPNESSPIYTKPLTLDKTCQLKMRAWDKWGKAYETSTLDFERQEAVEPVNPKVAQGLDYKIFKGSFRRIPEFEKLTASAQGSTQVIEPHKVAKMHDEFGMQLFGYIKVPKTGLYTFNLKSDDGSRLTIAGQQIVELNILSDRDPWESKGSIPLKAGLHPIQIDYFQYKINKSLEIMYSVDGSEMQEVELKQFFRKDK